MVGVRIVYVGLGKDLHVGGVAEWLYRISYYLTSLGVEVTVITNVDIPEVFRGDYGVIKVRESVRVPSTLTSYYAIDFMKYASRNFAEALNLISGEVMYVFYDPILASFFKLVTDVKPVWYSHIHELITPYSTSFVRDKEFITSLRSLLRNAIVATQTELNRDMLRSSGVDAVIWTIPLAPEYKQFKPHPEDFILYSAGFDIFKNPPKVFKVIELLVREGFRVVVVGGRANRKLKVEGVEVIEGPVPRREYYGIHSRALLGFHCSRVEAFSINTMDHGYFHPVILPSGVKWAEYWRPMPKARTAREYVNIIKSLYRNENLYEEVQARQKVFIEERHSPGTFTSQFEFLKETYFSQSKLSKAVSEALKRCRDDILKCLGWKDKVTAYKYILGVVNLPVKDVGWW